MLRPGGLGLRLLEDHGEVRVAAIPLPHFSAAVKLYAFEDGTLGDHSLLHPQVLCRHVKVVFHLLDPAFDHLHSPKGRSRKVMMVYVGTTRRTNRNRRAAAAPAKACCSSAEWRFLEK